MYAGTDSAFSSNVSQCLANVMHFPRENCLKLKTTRVDTLGEKSKSRTRHVIYSVALYNTSIGLDLDTSVVAEISMATGNGSS